MEYYTLVDIDDKKLYYLGSKTSAKYLLPYIAKLTEGHNICFFGDETHAFLEDKYEDRNYEKYEINVKNMSCQKWNLSYETFSAIFDDLGGVETNEFCQKFEFYIKNK